MLPSEAGASAPKIVIVVARARNGVIGRDNALPWHLPEDLQHFKATTMGGVLIMGRKTFESIGRPLPGRRTLVLTRDPEWSHPGVERAESLGEALARCADRSEVFVVGGAEVFRQALPRADRIVLTEIAIDPEGDTRFELPEASDWRSEPVFAGLSRTGLSYGIRVLHRA